MNAILNKTIVQGIEEVKDTMVKRVGRFLCFKTEAWEVAKTDHIGNDLHIKTDREIRDIYLNGKIYQSKQ